MKCKSRFLSYGFLTLLLAPLSVQSSEPADFVIRSAAVYTVDAARSWAEALAVKGNEIVYVGGNTGVQSHIGPKTRIMELDGKMVLPGFQDSHIHPIGAMMKSKMCQLRGLGSIDEYLARISECLKDDPDTEWVRGSGWSHAYFDDENRPDKKLLDKISDGRPITLVSYDGHSVWANSEAMRRSGIGAETRNPAAGIIERYPDSQEPIGLFLEDPAIEMIYRAMPDDSDEDRFDALLEVQAYLHSLGVTSVQDAWVDLDNVGVYGTLPAYQKAAREGLLGLRVIAALYWHPNKGMEQLERMKQTRLESALPHFSASSVKLWQDGVMHTHTSKLLEDYSNRPGEKGLSMFTQDELNHIITALDAEGFQVHVHADGDGALRETLDAFSHARMKNGTRDNRHHIAHLELVHPDDIPRFRQLGVIANVQPLWSTSRYYIGDLLNNKLGEHRKPRMEINRSFLKHGVTVAYGSDWFVTSPNPMDLLEAAVTRIRPALPLPDKRTAEPVLPGEEVTLADAIVSYTINGAFANHQDKLTGSLEVGKLADLVVLDRNLFESEAVRISETKVLMTFFNGKLVYESQNKAKQRD